MPILHLDADAFFASCEQAVHPELKGKPVVTGAERGIISAASYEAKALGVKRGISLIDAKKLCPQLHIIRSDYELYASFSKRMFAIMRRFTGEVEEYSIDEAFADLTGFGDAPELTKQIKETIECELNITVSAGLAATKTLAKLASSFNKPSGVTCLVPDEANDFLKKIPVGKVWGIGRQTEAWCRTLRIETAFDFASQSLPQVRSRFTKPHQEAWHELNGRIVHGIATENKDSFDTISKTNTFRPPSHDRDFVRSELLANWDNAFAKARRYKLSARGAVVFLKGQDFRFDAEEITFTEPTAYPIQLSEKIEKAFQKLFHQSREYRATGVTLTGLTSAAPKQANLFENKNADDRLASIYKAIDFLEAKNGRRTIITAASLTPATRRNHEKTSGSISLNGNLHHRRLNLPQIEIRLNNNL